MKPRASWQKLGAAVLGVQSLGAAIWWALLWTQPSIRSYFRPTSTPDSALMAFFIPDALLFIGAGLWAAWLLWRHSPQAKLLLALHTGATIYASLYCIMQWVMTGEAILAAIFMSPCLLIGPLLLWKLGRE